METIIASFISSLVDTVILFIQQYLLVPSILALGNNILVENIKDGIKSAYPECRVRFWIIISFVFVIGIILYTIYAIMQGGTDPIGAIYTPILSIAFYHFKPFRRLLSYAKLKAKEKGAVDDEDV
jgi:K+ transporter